MYGKVRHLALDCLHKFDKQDTNSSETYKYVADATKFRPHANLYIGNILAIPATIYDPNGYLD